MRYNDFVNHIRDTFHVAEQQNYDLAVDISDAMTDANRSDRGNIGSFDFEGTTYYIRTAWKDGCINYDCNPATCWTDWTISTE